MLADAISAAAANGHREEALALAMIGVGAFSDDAARKVGISPLLAAVKLRDKESLIPCRWACGRITHFPLLLLAVISPGTCRLGARQESSSKGNMRRPGGRRTAIPPGSPRRLAADMCRP